MTTTAPARHSPRLSRSSTHAALSSRPPAPNQSPLFSTPYDPIADGPASAAGAPCLTRGADGQPWPRHNLSGRDDCCGREEGVAVNINNKYYMSFGARPLARAAPNALLSAELNG